MYLAKRFLVEISLCLRFIFYRRGRGFRDVSDLFRDKSVLIIGPALTDKVPAAGKRKHDIVVKINRGFNQMDGEDLRADVIFHCGSELDCGSIPNEVITINPVYKWRNRRNIDKCTYLLSYKESARICYPKVYWPKYPSTGLHAIWSCLMLTNNTVEVRGFSFFLSDYDSNYKQHSIALEQSRIRKGGNHSIKAEIETFQRLRRTYPNLECGPELIGLLSRCSLD